MILSGKKVLVSGATGSLGLATLLLAKRCGWNASVTITDGTQDTTTGLILGPGVDSGWIPVANTNLLFYVGSVASDKFTYLTVAP